MTREEEVAIKELKKWRNSFNYDCGDYNYGDDTTKRALDFAIKIIEQKPDLNKIRAEIKQRSYGVANDSVIQGMKYERAAILEILDKYIGEREG